MSAEWWEKNKQHYLSGTPHDRVAYTSSTGFCGSCGTWCVNPKTIRQRWRQYYLVGAFGCTPEQAKEILQVQNDPAIVTHSITQGGETYTFLWKDE